MDSDKRGFAAADDDGGPVVTNISLPLSAPNFYIYKKIFLISAWHTYFTPLGHDNYLSENPNPTPKADPKE